MDNQFGGLPEALHQAAEWEKVRRMVFNYVGNSTLAGLIMWQIGWALINFHMLE